MEQATYRQPSHEEQAIRLCGRMADTSIQAPVPSLPSPFETAVTRSAGCSRLSRQTGPSFAVGRGTGGTTGNVQGLDRAFSHNRKRKAEGFHHPRRSATNAAATQPDRSGPSSASAATALCGREWNRSGTGAEQAVNRAFSHDTNHNPASPARRTSPPSQQAPTTPAANTPADGRSETISQFRLPFALSPISRFRAKKRPTSPVTGREDPPCPCAPPSSALVSAALSPAS